MELGAIELYLATNNASYLQQAAQWAWAYIKKSQDQDTINLYPIEY
jgi:hypothetical protein